ncbi:DUF3939 domain-containing protein [Paenibacillus dakarensis]|uniref:DUF3939 domain-containing protein n=1 Tax=Paenibacillus dakarensis TaxID=1527293 RepID=UPI000ABBA62D|nr:DUF3939 domain-containing protein [Paenibacillus dakarensis]
MKGTLSIGKAIPTAMKKAAYTAFILTLLSILTTGCMYPSDNEQDSQVSYRESVKRIQSAVDDFYKEQSVLPILTADAEVPRYEKYRVDLDKLKNMGYIDEIPKTAFENGGSAYFLIINEESEPSVKVLDLNTKQKVNEVQMSVNRYKTANNGTLPTGDELYPGLFAVDISKTDVKNMKLKSVYSGQEAVFMMDNTGTVYIDYAFDIMQAVDKEKAKPKSDEDLRVYLEQASYFAPVKSTPYYWKDNQPVAQL